MASKNADDIELAHALARGEHAAFEQLYRRHNPAMIRVATAMLRNRASAEEVAQDSWIKVLRHANGYEGRSSLAGWIFTILANTARTRASRDGRMISFDDKGSDDGLADAFDGKGRWAELPDLWEEVTPERVIQGRTLLAHVTAAIDRLPRGQRAVLILRGQQELEAAEVCEALGISDGAMRVQLHRARLALRAELARILESDAST